MLEMLRELNRDEAKKLWKKLRDLHSENKTKGSNQIEHTVLFDSHINPVNGKNETHEKNTFLVNFNIYRKSTHSVLCYMLYKGTLVEKSVFLCLFSKVCVKYELLAVAEHVSGYRSQTDYTAIVENCC